MGDRPIIRLDRFEAYLRRRVEVDVGGTKIVQASVQRLAVLLADYMQHREHYESGPPREDDPKTVTFHGLPLIATEIFTAVFPNSMVAWCDKFECQSWGISEGSSVNSWARQFSDGPWYPVLERNESERDEFQRRLWKCPRCNASYGEQHDLLMRPVVALSQRLSYRTRPDLRRRGV